jgi:hypothetical protein
VFIMGRNEAEAERLREQEARHQPSAPVCEQDRGSISPATFEPQLPADIIPAAERARLAATVEAIVLVSTRSSNPDCVQYSKRAPISPRRAGPALVGAPKNGEFSTPPVPRRFERLSRLFARTFTVSRERRSLSGRVTQPETAAHA